VLQSTHRHLYVVVPLRPATILSWGGLPTYCLGGGICRRNAGYDETYDCSNFDSYFEPNNVASNCRNNGWYDFSNNSR